MKFLLDTNVLSEAKKPKPDAVVLKWLAVHELTDSYLSVMTLGEIEEGIERLGKNKKASTLRAWLDQLQESFAGRILPIDEDICLLWGKLRAKAKLKGKPVAVIDALLAATAIHHELTLVTRNLKDVEGLGVKTLNPWLK